MKNFDSHNMKSTNAIEAQVWSIAQTLRSESISIEDYYVLLFLLSAYKDNLLPEQSDPFEPNQENKLTENISKLHTDLAIKYRSIFNAFLPILSQIRQRAAAKIINDLNKIDKDELTRRFPEIFDSLMYRIALSEGRISGEFIQPIEVTRLMLNMVSLPKSARVYNPFAGLASFGVLMNEGQYYFGQEINHRSWALGALRLMAYNRPGITDYKCEDTLINWPDDSRRFDLIIANPPYGIRINRKQYPNIDQDLQTLEQILIEKGINSLASGGKLITLLPQGFLFQGGVYERLRQRLINRDLIDTIISLPGGIMYHTGIPLALVVINKSKKIPGRIRLVDAEQFFTPETRIQNKLNDYQLSEYLLKVAENDSITRFVSIDQVKKQNYDLNVSRYFIKEVKEGVSLKNLLTYYRGERSEINNSVRIKDLSDNNIQYRLDSSKLESIIPRQTVVRALTKSCILMARNFRSLKPTYFEFTGEPLYTNQNILSFEVDESKVNVSYLINELYAEYVEEQVDAYRTGGARIPFIKRDDLLEVKIKLPSLEAQRTKIQGIIELSERIKELEKERNALAHGKEVSRFSEFASLKHTLGRPRQNILDWADNLLDFMNSNKEELDGHNKKFVDFYSVDMISALEEIKRDVNFMTSVLEKGEKGFVVEDYEKDFIPFSEVNKIIRELSANGLNFKLNKQLIEGEKLNQRGIYGNKTLLKTLFDNILTNAHKHGFKSKEKGNEVVINLTEVEEELVIEVKNNGAPFPKNFDKENFISKYSTADTKSGTGLGGYDVHRIAELFGNPDWELILNDDPIYRVKFKFNFPTHLIVLHE